MTIVKGAALVRRQRGPLSGIGQMHGDAPEPTHAQMHTGRELGTAPRAARPVRAALIRGLSLRAATGIRLATLTCTFDGVGRSLWLADTGRPVRVRVKFGSNSKLPHALAVLDGRTIEPTDLAKMLPPLAASSFKTVDAGNPEIRADVDNWHISLLLAPSAAITSRTSAVELLKHWVAANWPHGTEPGQD